MARNFFSGKTTSGATVTVYWAGTTTAPTIYVSATGASKSNPITADFDGSYAFWIDDGHYKILNGKLVNGVATNIDDIYITTTPVASPNASEIAVVPFRGNTATTLEDWIEGQLGAPTFPSLTSGRVPYISTGGLITDSANLTYVATLASGGLTVANTTDSSSTSTGAIITAGGAGIAKKLYVGTTANIAGVLTAADATASSSTATGSIVSSGGIGVAKNSWFGANVVQESANGAQWIHGQVSELLTLTPGASNHDSVANLLPANSVIEAVTGRVTTTISGGSLAVGTITMSGVAVADETFVVGTQTFTWKASRAGAGQVTIGANAAAAVTNIVTAINTDIPGQVTASDGAGDTVVVTAVAGGTAGNAIVFTAASTNMAVDGTGTLGGTTLGANVTSWTLADTSTAARFAAANTTLSTSGNSIGVKQWLGGVATDGAGPTQAAAAKVRITTDQIVQAGAVRITVFYRQFVAPTS